MHYDTLLRCRRVISLTAYCLACQYGMSVRSPFSLFSRGKSHIPWDKKHLQMKVSAQVTQLKVQRPIHSLLRISRHTVQLRDK